MSFLEPIFTFALIAPPVAFLLGVWVGRWSNHLVITGIRYDQPTGIKQEVDVSPGG